MTRFMFFQREKRLFICLVNIKGMSAVQELRVRTRFCSDLNGTSQEGTSGDTSSVFMFPRSLAAPDSDQQVIVGLLQRLDDGLII